MRLPTVPGLAFAGFLALGSCSAAEAQTIANPDQLGVRVDQWVKPYVSAGDFSGVLLIAQGDRILVEKSYGLADIVHKVPNHIETRFRIASFSKTFTAAGIELLIRHNRIGLKDPLSRYVTGIANGEEITIEQLLSHESGVGVVDEPDRYRNCLSSADLLERLRKAKPLFPPGKGDQYSNEGYFLLALVIEKVSGSSYERFLQQNIFNPLGMKNTGSTCKELPAGPNAAGHVPGAGEKSVVSLPFSEAVEVGPGSIYSNVRDLAIWLRAVDTNLSFMNQDLEYPYGWGKRNYSGRPLIEQSGILEGFNAHMALYAKEHVYAVVLSNIQSGFFNRIPKDLEAVLFGGEPSLPPEPKAFGASALKLRDYTGEYSSPATPYHQTLVIQDGRLSMRWGSFPFWRGLTAVGEDQFFFRYEYAELRFERDSAGKVVRMIWKWPQGDPMIFNKLANSAISR